MGDISYKCKVVSSTDGRLIKVGNWCYNGGAVAMSFCSIFPKGCNVFRGSYIGDLSFKGYIA